MCVFFAHNLGYIMPAKTFNEAQNIRTQLIQKLKQCKTLEELNSILAQREKESDKYELNNKLKLSLSFNQNQRLNSQNAEIQSLIEKRTNKLSHVNPLKEVDLPDHEVTFYDLDAEASDFSDEDDAAEVKVEEVKPADVKTEEVKPTDVKAEEVKPADVKAEEVKPADVKAEEVKPVDVKAEEVKPVDVKAEEIKPADVKVEEVKSAILELPRSNSSDLKSNHARIEELKPVREQLAKIIEKQTDLAKRSTAKNDSFDLASQAALRVIAAMEKAQEDYVTDKISKPQLINRAKNILTPVNVDIKTLNTHRGWKQVLTNLLTAVLGLGVFYGIAAAAVKSFTLFPVATDSGNKLKSLEQSIDALEAPAPK